ncbi:MAG: HAMP domain-containing histidine kinase [Caldilineaceae bacterium]|nr:HAMP domain-containing histidine kinase [Caldilineaceae bacterium]
MSNPFRRFADTLSGRLLLTHMLVAAAVLVVAALLVLILQAPVRTEFMQRRMNDWLQPAIIVARSGLAGTLVDDESGAQMRARFLNYLRTQADAQDGRVLLVEQPGSQILFDTDDALTGQTWRPLTAHRSELRPLRTRPGILGPAQQSPIISVSGRANLDGVPWAYTSAQLAATNAGSSVDLVILKEQPTFLQTIIQVISEIPRGLLAVIGLALVALIFVLSRWTAGAVSRGLSPLMDGTRALAEGNLAYRVDTQATALAEVQALSSSFNQMADRVQQSQQAQRDFIANVSHDLKTPLTSIQGYSQALLDGTAATAASQQRAALVINQEAQRLANLVEEVIDLARLDSGRLTLRQQQEDINQLVGELAEAFAPRSEAAQIRFTWRPWSQPVMAAVDGDRLRRAIANLVDNALTYTPAGGTVTLSVQQRTDAESRGFVEIDVADTGPGIPPEEQQRIFERFYRVDKSRGGNHSAGLGLAIVKEIVEAHGGTVGVRSTPEAGSHFWVKLPLAT